MIEGLQVKNKQDDGRVYYHPAVLTVNRVSDYHDDEIAFKEINGFWGLKWTEFVFAGGPREEGTNPGDGKLHVGDVAEFELDQKPKRGSNAKPGSYYYNISSVGSSKGEPPIAAQRQTESSGSTWSGASTSASAQAGAPDAKDIRIGKAQAVNLLFATLNADQKKTVAASKIIAAMGFESIEEAAEVAANAWNQLRNGLPLEIAIAEAPVEEDEVNEPVEAEVEENPDEVVETLGWN